MNQPAYYCPRCNKYVPQVETRHEVHEQVGRTYHITAVCGAEVIYVGKRDLSEETNASK